MTSARSTNALRSLIGFDSIEKPYESFYVYVSRLLRCNLMNAMEMRRRIPAEWLQTAFSSDLQVPARLVSQLREIAPGVDLHAKLQVDPWVPFASLNSIAPEQLRVCALCLEDGYHTYAWHSDAIERCPVHDEALTTMCGRCESPLVRVARVTAPGALECPRGCTLVGGLHSGLDPEPNRLTRALDAHLDWVSALRARIAFVSGPIHVVYPPIAHGDASIRTPPRPSPGLLPAMLDTLRLARRAVPELLPFHAHQHERWILSASRWPSVAGDLPRESQVEALRRAFRRGVYQTYLPLFDAGATIVALAQCLKTLNEPMQDVDGVPVLAIPSYLVTNSEITALRRLLARNQVSEVTPAHYQAVLHEFVERAFLRRTALNRIGTASNLLCVAERFDAVVRVGRSLLRVSGATQTEPAGQGAWRGFRELAEIPGGFIHVSDRTGPA